MGVHGMGKGARVGHTVLRPPNSNVCGLVEKAKKQENSEEQTKEDI